MAALKIHLQAVFPVEYVNILKNRYLPKIAVVRYNMITASDGKQYMVEHYSLDLVLSLQGLDGNMGKDETTRKTTWKTREDFYNALDKSPDLTNKELATICGITADGVYYQLKQMKTSGLIRRVGPDKGGHWEVIK